jgi:Na+-driven multidrug efflux pump
LGPAEVAAWSILGTLWDVFEDITESIADASEVRVGVLLGNGKPGMAKKSAHKSIFIGFVFALVSTSCLFIAGDSLSSWLTVDPTLQMLINELIPLFGLGNIVLTMGTMAWTIVGAQGRYRLSTAIGVAGSWLITLPLAAVFTIALKFNLQGQTAAVVIGYMVSGTVTNVVLLQSDWEALSKKVIELNKEEDYDSDDESGSSSSSADGNSPPRPDAS